MTNEQKIKKLTGATAAVINYKDGYFYHFSTITADHAEEMLTSEGYLMGKMTTGHLWIACLYSENRYVFVDKSLAEIAK